MAKITIDVTADDIASGRMGDCQRCPIASALLRQGFYEVDVGTDDAGVRRENGPWISFQLPDEARDFISSFDCDGQGWPFSFELEVA
ncbi:MAG TPA: hypothetical protein VNS22_27600 [Geminicoccus sp.]|uniref:hypothetical protein n=1 Tax=Geminicoccus sp. TaxID=2024832 RepID=UPI002B903C88|nr:hypothetical protein [Geminicoccus sp.]HWL72125.1 hypothetical protein [Geminicoccus sp.]